MGADPLRQSVEALFRLPDEVHDARHRGIECGNRTDVSAVQLHMTTRHLAWVSLSVKLGSARGSQAHSLAPSDHLPTKPCPSTVR